MSYTDTTAMHINVDTVDEATLAWYELCEVLTFLVDVAGIRADGKGLRNINDAPQFSELGSSGERHVRTAALMRCLALANAISPEHVVYLHDKLNKPGTPEASHE